MALTIEMPPQMAEYVRHRGPSFQSELNSIFIAFVTTEMQREGFEKSNPHVKSNGRAVFDAIRACPVDIDLDQLIPQRTSSGRDHPIDFSEMLREDV